MRQEEIRKSFNESENPLLSDCDNDILSSARNPSHKAGVLKGFGLTKRRSENC